MMTGLLCGGRGHGVVDRSGRSDGRQFQALIGSPFYRKLQKHSIICQIKISLGKKCRSGYLTKTKKFSHLFFV